MTKTRNVRGKKTLLGKNDVQRRKFNFCLLGEARRVRFKKLYQYILYGTVNSELLARLIAYAITHSLTHSITHTFHVYMDDTYNVNNANQTYRMEITTKSNLKCY